jgi:hypothetical protein
MAPIALQYRAPATLAMQQQHAQPGTTTNSPAGAMAGSTTRMQTATQSRAKPPAGCCLRPRPWITRGTTYRTATVHTMVCMRRRKGTTSPPQSHPDATTTASQAKPAPSAQLDQAPQNARSTVHPINLSGLVCRTGGASRRMTTTHWAWQAAGAACVLPRGFSCHMCSLVCHTCCHRCIQSILAYTEGSTL